MKKEKLTARCETCEIIFEFERKDIFADETFCPVCVERVKKENKFYTKKEAEAGTSGYRLLG